MVDPRAADLSKMMREEAEALRAEMRRFIAERRAIAAAMRHTAELSRNRLTKIMSQRDEHLR